MCPRTASQLQTLTEFLHACKPTVFTLDAVSGTWRRKPGKAWRRQKCCQNVASLTHMVSGSMWRRRTWRQNVASLARQGATWRRRMWRSNMASHPYVTSPDVVSERGVTYSRGIKEPRGVARCGAKRAVREPCGVAGVVSERIVTCLRGVRQPRSIGGCGIKTWRRLHAASPGHLLPPCVTCSGRVKWQWRGSVTLTWCDTRQKTASILSWNRRAT